MGHLLYKPKNIWHHIYLPIIAEDKKVIYSVNSHTDQKHTKIYSRKEGQFLNEEKKKLDDKS